jgi:hypothetical protein
MSRSFYELEAYVRHVRDERLREAARDRLAALAVAEQRTMPGRIRWAPALAVLGPLVITIGAWIAQVRTRRPPATEPEAP